MALVPMPPLTLFGKKLFLAGQPLASIAKRFNVTGPDARGPVYLYDAKRIRANAKRVRNALTDPVSRFSTRIYYAVKCNSNPALVRILQQQGFGADCCNFNEVKIARMAGVPASKILYSGNNNPMREIEQAKKLGVAINFDDIGLFERSTLALRASRRPSSLISFRYNPGVGLGENAKITTAGRDSKFGMDEKELMRAYRLAKRRGITRFGLHMMTGSNTLAPELFVRQVRQQLKMAGRLCQALGIELEFIDIGGGFGVPYRPGQKALDIKKLGRHLIAQFVQGCSEFKVRGKDGALPALALEPGRIFLADAAVLLAQVTHVKRTFGKRIIGLEASMATLMRPAMYNAYHHIYIDGKAGASPARGSNARPSRFSPADVVGMACENSDYFARNRLLPSDVAVGDLAIICTAGAYGYSMSSNYCNLPRPAEVLMDGKSARLIRKRESFEDLVRQAI